MKMTIDRSTLIKPLQLISSIVERRHTMPILANVMLTAAHQKLSLVGTDLEIELVGTAFIEKGIEIDGSVTVSARKLLDICRALPEDAILQMTSESNHLLILSDKSRFVLSTLASEDFPTFEEAPFLHQFSMSQANLKKLLSKVYFAMGTQDTRFYLNGAVLDINQGIIKCIATDGHRLAYSFMEEPSVKDMHFKIILPRKGVLELMRLLDATQDKEISLSFGNQHFRAVTSDFIFTSKLISAQCPDYDKLIPRDIKNNIAMMDREKIKQALMRTTVLLNEKFRGIRLQAEQNIMRLVANNPEQEEAEEIIPIEYNGSGIEFGFNASYLLDVVSILTGEKIQWSFTDAGGVLIEPHEKDNSFYVVMPLRI